VPAVPGAPAVPDEPALTNLLCQPACEPAFRFIGADYTKLGSFGTALDFASGVINKMDNSYILRLPEWRRAKEGPVQVGGRSMVGRSIGCVGGGSGL
jgi:hypothetical protein